VIGTLGFSFKAILIKLAYAASAVDAITLLALRMLYAAPFFVAMAWWSGRTGAPLARRDWLAVTALGFLGYYLASLLDFLGLRYVSASWCSCTRRWCCCCRRPSSASRSRAARSARSPCATPASRSCSGTTSR
jgi:hypothetical protein